MGGDESQFTKPAIIGSTIEDASLAREIIVVQAVPEAEVITSDFHVRRADFGFRRVLPNLKLSFWGSKCIEQVSAQKAKQLLPYEETRLEVMRGREVVEEKMVELTKRAPLNPNAEVGV